MSLTNFGESAILDRYFGGGSPATLYYGLSTSDPGETGSLTGEPTSAGGYARVAKTNNTTEFPNGNPKANGTLVTFPTSSAAWSTGATNLAFWFLTDSATLGAGNMIASGPLSVGRAVNAAGVTLEAAIGALTLTAD